MDLTTIEEPFMSNKSETFIKLTYIRPYIQGSNGVASIEIEDI